MAPCLVALVLALVYARFTPMVGDLAAQTARGDLFRRSGDVAWWTSWYGGVATSSYSLVTPALLGWLGPVLLGAASLVLTPLAAVPLLRRSMRPLAGGVVLSLTAAVNVAAGRITFAAGVVLAVLVLSACVLDRPCWAATFALLAVFTSPVAGLLTVLVAVAVAAVEHPRRPWLAAAAGGVAGLGVLWWLAYGVGVGHQPFDIVDLSLTIAGAACVLLAPVGRVLRAVAAACILAALVAYVVPTPIGSNLLRVVYLGAAPVLVANARLRPHLLLLAGLVGGILPCVDLVAGVAAASQPGSSEAFVTALRTRLASEPLLRDHRLEVVDVDTHWPSARLLPTVTLARGWERQTDEALNPELYAGPALTARDYRAFLDRFAVAFVAVPVGAALDFGSRREASLIASGLPYLTQVWHDAHWRLYQVTDPLQVVAAPAEGVRLTDTGVTFTAPRAGSYALSLRWSPYLVVSGGTGGHVTRRADDEVGVEVAAPGRYELHAVWRIP